MNIINATELQDKGVLTIENALNNEEEVSIAVNGEQRFVVTSIAHYQYLQECELEIALMQAKADIAAGKYKAQTAQSHLQEMIDEYAIPTNHY